MANQLNIIDINLFCNQSRFKYINKELACGDSFVVKKHAYKEFKVKVEDFIQQKVKEDEITEVSIYFRDLENGPTFGINEHAIFTPASLLKVPIMLTYLSLAENKPELLEKTLKFSRLKEGDLIHQSITPKDPIQENIAYSVRELLSHMIKYSDNNASFTLALYLNKQYPDGQPFFDTIRGFGLIDPEDIAESNLSVKSYASIFIQLYNSSFFSKTETSEEALRLLAESDFIKGIVAGVPSGISVAHKFGERQIADNEQKQFHDCGIVYYPKNPYLLCVMTRGDDFDKLPGVVSEISRMVYEEFESRRL